MNLLKVIPIPLVLRLKKISIFIARFLYVQLFVTLISLPILIAWGMPLSLLTFVGNLIFNQVLMIFLLLSSLVFFGEILSLPTSWPAYLLEKLTQWWLWVMDKAGHEWLMALPVPPWYIIGIIALCTLALCHARSIRSPIKGVMALTILFITIFLGLRFFYIPHTQLHQLACNNKTVPILCAQGKIIVIDPGVIGSRISARSWCEYTLCQSLAQKMGASSIDHFILMQPNILIFDALTSLCQKITIKTIYIPWWNGRVPHRLWRAYATFQHTAKEQGIRIVRIGSYPITIELPKDRLRIKPLKKRVKGDGFDYPCLQVTGKVDKVKVNIYSAKSGM